MKLTLRCHRRLPRVIAIGMAAGIVCAWAQTSPTPGDPNATGSSASGASANGVPTTSGIPAMPQRGGPQPGGGEPRPIFLSGTVMMDDGSPLEGSVDIQSVCGVVHRTMAHTTIKGDFEFRWTTTPTAFGDASQNGRVTATTGTTSLTGSRTGSRGTDPLANCDLIADSPGYSSSRVSLFDRGGQDSYNVGEIVLHRIAAGEGRTVSVLALRAPKNAKKSFEKGASLASANKTAEAIASFETAVAIDPQYADAWLALGKVQWQAQRKDAARASFQKAMDLDKSLVGPWQELGFLACDESKWEDAVRYLDQAVRLDPMDSASAWYFNALAHYNLGHFDLAERSVRAELKLDNGRNPHANYLLGLVLIARRDPAGGAQELRKYIASSPTAQDVESAKSQLRRLESEPGR